MAFWPSMNDSCGDRAGLARTRSVARVMYLPLGALKVTLGEWVRCWVASPVAQLRTSCNGLSADLALLRRLGLAGGADWSSDTCGLLWAEPMVIRDPRGPPPVPPL